MRLTFVTAIIVCAAGGAVLADDFQPPSWRGAPGSSWAKWEFNDAGAPVAFPPNSGFYSAPDAGYTPFGTPTLEARPGGGQSWQGTWAGRPGVWQLSGELILDIPNNPVGNEYKDIQLQLTWHPQAQGNMPVTEVSLNSSLDPSTPMMLVSTTSAGGDWFHSVYSLRLYPNPSHEWMLITAGIDVDEVVVDTICVPEPASLAVLGLGALAITRRRR